MRVSGGDREHRKLTSDMVVRRHREYLRRVIKTYSQRAAQKLLAALPSRVEKTKLSAERIAELITEEFEILYR
jgi:hypothetical protein